MSWLREPDAEPLPGYRLVSPLGTGGFGEVWKVVAPGNILKAIKFVYGNLNSLDGDAFRAEQEKKALECIKEVRHPFVLSTERIDIVEGDLSIVMELADKSLHDLHVEYQQMGLPGIPRAELLGFMRDAADGLDHLNDKHNLQHLDVKPRNLFLIGGRVKVADFGLVKNLERQSTSGLMAGVTPIYAAPETFGGKVTKTSDQYSLAIVYIELLTGKRPFNGKNIRLLALQHVSEPPDLSSLPEHDRPVVARALAKEPEDRFPNCLAFIRALYEADYREEEVRLGALPTPTPSSKPPTARRVTSGQAQRTVDDAPSAQLSATNAQVEVGVLRPTILIGLGSFGRRALLDLRCRLLDRFGDLTQVPIYRFLYIDSDPEAVHKALYDAPEVALSSTEVFPLPLQPVTNYRRRALEHLGDWLPREKLHAIPRSLQPQGSRALGRLAFNDNYLRFMTRIRRELQVATHPESLAQSLSATGVNLRDNKPRVYILASASGGSAGLINDLAYAVMRQMAQSHLAVSAPNLFLFCGSPSDPATPPSELANVYATLTELNHFADDSTTFTCQYGPDAQKSTETQSPFESAYLLTLSNRTPEAQRDCITHLANYLGHELTTPLAHRLESTRSAAATSGSRFRSFGTQSIWFPRGLLLRVAARQACQRLIEDWQHHEFNGSAAEVNAACARALDNPGLHWEALRQQLEKAAHSPEGTPSEILARVLTEVNEDADRPEVQTDAGSWAQQALAQLEEWVGARGGDAQLSVLSRSRFSVFFNRATQSVAEEWEKLLVAHISHLTDRPGRRLANCEEALRRMTAFCEQAAEAQAEVVEQQRDMVRTARESLALALESCRLGTGGLSRLFGVGPVRNVRTFLDQLRVFAYARLAEDTLDAGAQFFHKLRGRLDERLNDLGFCRQRLRHLQQALAEPADPAVDSRRLEYGPDRSPLPGDSFGSIFQSASTVRIVLPEGAMTLEQAALNFVAQLQSSHYQKLDEAIQAIVLAPLGGLQQICQKNSDLARLLAGPLIDQTAAFLSDHLHETDVAQVEASAEARDGQSLAEQIHWEYDQAEPLIRSKSGRQQSAYLLHPPSDAGENFAREALRQFPDLQLVPSGSQTDLTICREQGFLNYDELQPLLSLCREAYYNATAAAPISPHARFDVTEWLPLEP